MALQPTARHFRVDEYEAMAEAGILGEDDRLELIEGVIVEMTPVGRRHQACVDRLTDILVHRAARMAQVRIQGPIRLSAQTELQPDVLLLRPLPDFYASRPPEPDDVLLLIEVADTSSSFDHGTKVPLYARNGVAEVWVVDVTEEIVTVYRDPTPAGYRTVETARGAEVIAPLAFPSWAIQVSDILP